MATFQYAGVQAGKKINGVISASDPRAAATELRKKKIIVTSIKKGNGKSDSKGPPSLDDIPISNAPIIPLYYDKVMRFTHKNVYGLKTNPVNQLDLRMVYKK